MSDPRVALRYPDLWKGLAQCMAWLINLPHSLWETLGGLAGTPADKLQSLCIGEGQKQLHFCWRRFLEPAAGLPWKLCRGDVARNLQELKEDDEPEDPVSKQLWALMHCDNFTDRQVERAVALLAECPWTNLPCEQLHGSLATFRRWHPSYGTETLVARSLMHQFVRIINPKLSKNERQLATLVTKIKRLTAKQPEKRSATSQWLAEVMALLRTQPGEEPAVDWNTTFAAQVCRMASAQWAAMAVQEQAKIYAKTHCGVLAKKKELASVLK
eukprot:5570984-Lingulodinium_polyedra.AAC.1